MGSREYLGEFELMVLLAILRLKDAAYGVPLARELAAARERNVSAGSIYAALDRLETKGLVTSTLGEATRERGGRAKRYFALTAEGMYSVRSSRAALMKLGDALPLEDLA